MDTPKPIMDMTDAELQAHVEAALAALGPHHAARLRLITETAVEAEEEAN